MASVVASCDLAVCTKLSLDGDGRLVCDDSGEPCPVDDDQPSGAPDEWPGLRDSPDRVQGRAKGGAARTPHAQHQTSGGSASTDRSGPSSAAALVAPCAQTIKWGRTARRRPTVYRPVRHK
eukprot:scaffold22225_cov72-Phaeocystis_antarctica.AAC.6